MSPRHARRIERQVRRDLSRPQKVSQSRRERRAEVSREGQRAWGRRQRMMLDSLRMPRWMVLFASLWLVVTLTCSPAFLVPHLLAASGGELLVDVGNFTTPAATGSQSPTLTAGKTWTPKSIIFFTAGSRTTSGTWQATIFQCLGFTAGASNSYAVAGSSDDGVATSNTGRSMRASAIVLADQGGGADWGYASLTSFNAGGFTLSWTKTSGSQPIIGYIALGGDIQAEVLNWDTGNSTGNKSVSIGTFQPDLVLHASAFIFIGPPPGSALPLSTTDSYFALGAMNSAGEQWTTASVADDNVSPSNASRVQRTDSCLHYTNPGEAAGNRMTYVSMDANGFTVNRVQNETQYAHVVSLCIKGVKSKLGAFNKSTSGAPVTQSITAPGFSPVLAMLASVGITTSTSPAANTIFEMGASDGTNERSVIQVDVDAANPTLADSIYSSTKGFMHSGDTDGTPSVQAEADLAFTATGFDATWTTNNAAAIEVLYAALAAKD